MNVLNLSGTGTNEEDRESSRSPVELANYLQRAMLQIKAEHISPDGREVDYSNLTKSKSFSDYVKVSHELVTSDPTPLSEDERKAFFINIYNCLTIQGLATAEQLPTSVLELSEFWKKTCYSIKGMVFSLDDIEHGVLRGNRPHPSADKPPFADDDPRKAMALQTCDPRIHFTLVCGAKSCPAIQVYSAKNLERGLSGAACSFCSQEVQVEPTNRRVKLSKIFVWYGTDFADNDRDLLQYVSQYATDETRERIEEMLSTEDHIEISYSDYNWQLNKL